MATIIPIKLSHATNNVLQVISLYPMSPPFQPGLAPKDFIRDTSRISFGFPFSNDTPYDGIDLTSVSASGTGSDLPGVYPLPPNAYALLLPSQIFNNNTVLDTSFGILLIDVTVCPVQPGISQLRVDYIANLMSPNGSIFNESVTDYLDMPFWEGWDNHPSLLQNIVDYSEETTDFLQSEINALSKDLYNNLNRAQVKGLSLSGQLYATQALQLNSSATPTDTPPTTTQKYLESKFTEYQKATSKSVINSSNEKSTYVYNITNVSPPNGVFPGEQITVTTDVSMLSTDQIYLATYPLISNVNGNTITATIPETLTFGLTINLSIVGQNITKSALYPLSIFNNPNILSINGIGDGFVAPGASFVLYGQYLGLTQGATTIYFNSLPATITSWTEKAITGIVPSNALTGPVILTTDKGATTSTVVNVLTDKQLDVFAITPEVSIVQANQTIQFLSTLNSQNVNSNWSLVDDFGNINNGDIAHGFINSATGLYTAPQNVPTNFNLKVVANHTRYYGTVYDEASILVLAAANTYTVSPSSAILEPSYTQPFQLFDNTNSLVTGVIWYVNGFAGGTSSTGVINYQGLYQAPNILPTTGTLNVTGIGPNGSATAIVSIASVGSTGSSNTITGSVQSHSINSKSIPSPACCLLPVVNTYSATVGTPLLITDFATSNGLNTNQGVTSYVTAFLQSNCGNQDGNLYVGTGGNLNNYGLISYIPQSVGFASIQVLSTTTFLSGGTPVTEGGYATILVDIAAAPIPILSRIDAGCPGQNVVVTGQYFPPDARLVFTSNNQILPTVVPPNTVDGINYSMTITIPSNLSNLSNTYNLELTSSFTSNSNTIDLTIPTSCLTPTTTAQFVLTPKSGVINTNATLQYNAVLEFSDGSQQNVNSGVTWYVGTVLGGNSTIGHISNSGLYTAPSNISGVNSPVITAVYVYQNKILQDTAYASVIMPSTHSSGPSNTPSPAPASSVGSTCLLTVSPNIATVIVPGNTIQFYANFSINNRQSTVVAASQWFVNGVAGGNAIYGTISNTGLYTPPAYYIPTDVQSVTVGASLNYTPTNGSLNTYSGYSIITFQQVTTQSGNSEVIFAKQLNLNLGDGRIGYVPARTTLYCTAGSYVYVTYQEILDSNFIPVVNNVPQLLTYGSISAQSPQLLSVLYNEGTIVQDTNNDGGTYYKPLTIPIGIVDPTTGIFQSMWDLIPVITPQANVISPQPLTYVASHEIEESKFNIISHIDQTFKNETLPINFNSLDKILWFGKAEYANGGLTFEKSISALNFDKVSNSLAQLKIDSKKYYDLAPNQLLIATNNDSNKWQVEVLSLGDTLPSNSRIYVLGIVTDHFYSLWPLLKVESSLTKHKFETNDNYLKIGDLIFQWGVLSGSQVKFPVEFKNSYSLKTTASKVEQTLSGFNFTIIDKEPNHWFAVGS